MRKKQGILGTLLAVMVLSGVANAAYNPAQADALFNQRATGSQAISQARTAYEQALGTTSGADLLLAVERLGRLAYYEGDLTLPDGAKDAKNAIFNQCLTYIENINPDKVGNNVQYSYWKALCLGEVLKTAGIFEAMGKVGDFKNTLNQSLATDANYEFGGGHRLYAAAYSKDSSNALVGMWDLDSAMNHINQAIAIAPDHFNCYLIKAQIFLAKGDKASAVSLLQSSKDSLAQRIRSRNLPKGYEPESVYYYKQINALLSSL